MFRKLGMWLGINVATHTPSPTEVKIRQQVNPEYLEILFKGLPKENFQESFFKEKLKPAMLTDPDIRSAGNSCDYGNTYATVSIRISDRKMTDTVVSRLRPILQKVFNKKFDVVYEELPILDYL